MNVLPDTVEMLVRELDETYPLVSPKVDESERQIFVRVGQREVIDGLLARLTYTQELA